MSRRAGVHRHELSHLRTAITELRARAARFGYRDGSTPLEDRSRCLRVRVAPDNHPMFGSWLDLYRPAHWRREDRSRTADVLAEAISRGISVSSFVSRKVQSHVFSTVFSNLAASSEMLKTGEKREK